MQGGQTGCNLPIMRASSLTLADPLVTLPELDAWSDFSISISRKTVLCLSSVYGNIYNGGTYPEVQDSQPSI